MAVELMPENQAAGEQWSVESPRLPAERQQEILDQLR
jgi:hypothetical protein